MCSGPRLQTHCVFHHNHCRANCDFHLPNVRPEAKISEGKAFVKCLMKTVSCLLSTEL